MDDQRANREGGGIRFRKLRIAWSIWWVILCLSLIVLWVRSNSKVDTISTYAGGQMISMVSNQGTVYAVSMFVPPGLRSRFPAREQGWHHGSRDVSVIGPIDPDDELYGFEFTSKDQWLFRVPNYLPIMITIAFAVVPWLRWSNRFSLRTLIIVMTVVAIGAGVIVYAHRR